MLAACYVERWLHKAVIHSQGFPGLSLTSPAAGKRASTTVLGEGESEGVFFMSSSMGHGHINGKMGHQML